MIKNNACLLVNLKYYMFFLTNSLNDLNIYLDKYV